MAASAFLGGFFPVALIAIPFLLLVIFVPSRGMVAFVGAVIAAGFAFGGAARTGLWYLERGWGLLVGGWFVAATLRWPESRFTPRALGAVLGALVVAVLFFAAGPERWSVVDWMVRDRLADGMAMAIDAFGRFMGEGGEAPASLIEASERTVEVQGAIFPALTALSTFAALGVAWWLYVRLGHGSDQALGPLSRFRFNDQLIWVLVVGVALLVVGWNEAVSRAGTNAVVFMGGLYALRGAAVMVFLSGGISLLGGILVGLGLLLPVVAQVILGGALMIGVGDTWLDLRARALAAAGVSDNDGTDS